MKEINNWINDLILVLFPAELEENELEADAVEEIPIANFVVLILLVFTVGMLILSVN